MTPLLHGIFLLISAFPVGSETVETQQAPNVVIVITDDQGYGDLSCHGNPVLKTPNLDQLSRESTRLTDYHVSPTCSPTRAALMTGHWTNRTGVWHTIMGRSMLRENEVTMAKVFQDAGYVTGMFGKWHLGDNYPYRPEDRGFTEVLRHGGGGVGQTPDYWDNAYFDGSYWHNGTPVPVKGFCTDVFFDHAKKFIRTQKETGKPFLAYISTNAPHGPMHCPEEYSQPYADQGVGVANFLGMAANIDHNVGQLRAFLKEEGLAENTIFVFTTDNGSSSGWKIFNSKMRGHKGSEYDGGHRVPFFLHWPQGEFTSDREIPQLTAHVDILPTLIELCDIESPGIKFDGRSLVPLLRNQAALDPDSSWNTRILVTDSQRVKDPIKWRKSCVMSGAWRLVNGKELYNVVDDPAQQHNLAPQNPQRVERLTDFYESWWAELEPTFADETPIYVGHPAENPARLTSHDWITTGGAPWNQAQVRRAIHEKGNTGFWNINVHGAGTYEVSLRRWPRESGHAIDAAMEPGADVPGVRALRTAAGKSIHPVKTRLQIGEQKWESEYQKGSQEVTFQMKLEPGRTRLTARFIDAEGTEFGAYFVYVQKLK